MEHRIKFGEFELINSDKLVPQGDLLFAYVGYHLGDSCRVTYFLPDGRPRCADLTVSLHEGIIGLIGRNGSEKDLEFVAERWEFEHQWQQLLSIAGLDGNRDTADSLSGGQRILSYSA